MSTETLEAVQKVLDDISFVHGPIKIFSKTISYEGLSDNTGPYYILDIRAMVADRNHGNEIPIQHLSILKKTKIHDPKYIQSAVIKSLDWFLHHELLEAFHYNGKRIRDPHKWPEYKHWQRPRYA